MVLSITAPESPTWVMCLALILRVVWKSLVAGPMTAALAALTATPPVPKVKTSTARPMTENNVHGAHLITAQAAL